jgi:hypothetical protein
MAEQTTIEQATGAAQDLVRLFNNSAMTPPQSHAVWIRTECGPEGEFVRSICVSEHPRWKGKLSIPESHAGVPIEKVDWPSGVQ